MITKRVLIELLQDRLSGGEATQDIIGKYHRGAIQRALDIVFSDIVSNDRRLAVQMALPYTLNVASNKVLLPVKPILGMSGVISIVKDDVDIPTVNGVEERSLIRILNPNLRNYAYRVVGNYMFFEGVEGEIEINIVPSISDMGEDENVVVEQFMEELYSRVARIMSPMQPKEVYDNQVADTDLPKQG